MFIPFCAFIILAQNHRPFGKMAALCRPMLKSVSVCKCLYFY